MDETSFGWLRPLQYNRGHALTEFNTLIVMYLKTNQNWISRFLVRHISMQRSFERPIPVCVPLILRKQDFVFTL